MKQEPKKEKVQGECPKCNGSKHIQIPADEARTACGFKYTIECPTCKGTGKQPTPKEEVRMNRERGIEIISEYATAQLISLTHSELDDMEKLTEIKIILGRHNKKITQLYEKGEIG